MHITQIVSEIIFEVFGQVGITAEAGAKAELPTNKLVQKIANFT